MNTVMCVGWPSVVLWHDVLMATGTTGDNDYLHLACQRDDETSVMNGVEHAIQVGCGAVGVIRVIR